MKHLAGIRRVNAVVACALLVLFALHGVGNAFQLFGAGSLLPVALGWALLALACLHMVFGVAVTVAAVRAQRQAGAAYPGLNKRFWAVRVSGILVAALVAFHVAVFGQLDGGAGDPVRLAVFGNLQLAAHLLLAAALAVHILANLHPLMISLGVGRPGSRAADLGVVFAVVLLLAAAAFVVYYLRWAVV